MYSGESKTGMSRGIFKSYSKRRSTSTLHMDYIGPLQPTSKKYKHMLVIVDGFTKFVWIFPTKSTGTSEVLKKMKIMQDTFRNPRRIVTDRGTAFTSNEFKEYCNQQQIQHLTITTGVPTGNGQVERINGIISSVIAKMSAEKPQKWYKYTGEVQRAINGSYQRSIGKPI